MISTDLNSDLGRSLAKALSIEKEEKSIPKI